MGCDGVGFELSEKRNDALEVGTSKQLLGCQGFYLAGVRSNLRSSTILANLDLRWELLKKES